MNTPLRINAEDVDVWRRTCAAFLDCQGKKEALTVKCRRCGRLLGAAGSTDYGPLFTSWWTVDLPLSFETYVDGRKLSRGEALRHRDRDSPVTERSGPPIRDEGNEGVVALLELPPEMAQEYPDLMVRCADHGDAVLARVEVLNALGGPPLRVKPRLPRLAYVAPEQVEPLPGGGKPVQSSETRRVGGNLNQRQQKAAPAYLRSILPPWRVS